MEYQLETLGPEKFQQLAQSLLIREFPGVQVFPIGQADGGRDATSRKRGTAEFVVHQAKFARRPQAERSPHRWLMGVLREEIPKLQKLIPRGAAEFILVTNVSGTGPRETGSIDEVQAVLDTLPVPARCWWRDDIGRRLDLLPEVRWTYPELLSGVDALRVMMESVLTPDRERREQALRAYIADQHSRDEEVRFKQISLENRLLDLFVDVPATLPRLLRDEPHPGKWRTFHLIVRNIETAKYVLGDESAPEGADHLYFDEESSVGAGTLLLERRFQAAFPAIVLEGAPGQGKSTLAQYICQVHRMRLLGRAEVAELPPSHREAALRMPIRIDLRDYSLWLDRNNPFAPSDAIPDSWRKTLESFLAYHVSHYSGGFRFDVEDLSSSMARTPMLLVLDGLDEVAELVRRDEVVEEIQASVRRLSATGSELQVVITSRPAAFASSPRFGRDFTYLTLGDLNRSLIDDYAERWMAARRLDARERREFKSLLAERLTLPHLRDLARNPMQLAILMTLIRTRGTSLPDKRTALYDSYVDLFFSREAEKSRTVREHRELLLDLHRYAAWLLHSQAEARSGAGRIAVDDLIRELSEYLAARGHDASLITELFHGMVERVVALVSRVQGTLEFEVQPLREYFAASHLYLTAPHSSPGREESGTRLDRFAAIAPNPYWLNVARFYSGCYSIGELPSLAEQLSDMLADNRRRRDGHAATLTSMLLADWVFTQLPRTVEQLVSELLAYPSLRYLSRGIDQHESARGLVFSGANGRQQVVDHLFELALENLPVEQRREFAAVVKESESPDAIVANWRQLWAAVAPSDATSWLEFGTSLGITKDLRAEELDSLVAGPNGRTRLWLLHNAGQVRYITADEGRAGAVRDYILDETPGAHVDRKTLFSRLATAVDPGLLSLALFRLRTPDQMSLQTAVERHRIVRASGASEDSEAPLGDTDAEAGVRAFLTEWQTIAARPVIEWSTSTIPWAEVVAFGQGRWGKRWSWIGLATLAASVTSRSERGRGGRSLLNDAVGLTTRMRYARVHPGDVEYWDEIASSAVDGSDLPLISAALALWPNNVVFGRIEPQLARFLDRLDPGEFSRLVRLARLAGNAFPLRTLRASTSTMPSSPRSATVLAARSDAASRRLIFRSGITQGANDSVTCDLEFDLAMGELLSTSRHWRNALDRVSAAYVAGVRTTPLLALRRANRGSWDMPTAMSALVADKPHEYPGDLVTLALERAARDKKPMAVAKIAAAQGWLGTVRPDRSGRPRQARIRS